MNKGNQDIGQALKAIFSGIERLKNICKNDRQFTVDGRLVGDIGELIAAREFDIVLDKKSRHTHDARTIDGRDVQIKATFKESLTFGKRPILYLGLRLHKDGRHDVIFNGPGEIIARRFGHRSGFGEKLLSFPINVLRELSATVKDADRVPKRLP